MLEPAIKVKLILNNSNLPSFNITTGKIDEYLYFNKTERDLLIKQKNQIDSFNYSKEWDKNKKISPMDPSSSAPFGTYQTRLFRCSFLFQHK